MPTTKDTDWGSFYDSVGVTGKNAAGTAAAVRAQRAQQLARQKNAADTTTYMDTPNGRVYVARGTYNPNADQSRLPPGDPGLPINYPTGTVLTGYAPVPATTDEMLKARSDAANAAWLLAQEGDKQHAPQPATTSAKPDRAGGGGGAAAQPATVRGSATRRSYEVGRTYVSGGYKYKATNDGFVKVGRVDSSAAGKAEGDRIRKSATPTYSASGSNMSFQPRSVQDSTRWQTGY